jgi:feruloyl esterase
MTCVLLTDYPSLFKAGAVLAGAPFSTYTDPVDALSAMTSARKKNPEEWAALVRQQNPGYKGPYPKLIVAHGTKDKVVDIQNSYELIKQWSVVLHTDTTPTKTVADFAGNKDVKKKIYENKRKEEKIIFYEIANTGHTLAVDPGTGPTQGGHTGIFAVDKDFFSTYWIAKDFGLVK